jgi:hypothetical protein
LELVDIIINTLWVVQLLLVLDRLALHNKVTQGFLLTDSLLVRQATMMHTLLSISLKPPMDAQLHVTKLGGQAKVVVLLVHFPQAPRRAKALFQVSRMRRRSLLQRLRNSPVVDMQSLLLVVVSSQCILNLTSSNLNHNTSHKVGTLTLRQNLSNEIILNNNNLNFTLQKLHHLNQPMTLMAKCLPTLNIKFNSNNLHILCPP